MGHSEPWEGSTDANSATVRAPYVVGVTILWKKPNGLDQDATTAAAAATTTAAEAAGKDWAARGRQCRVPATVNNEKRVVHNKRSPPVQY